MKIPRGAVKFPQNKASWVGGADDNLKPFFVCRKMYSENPLIISGTVQVHLLKCKLLTYKYRASGYLNL